MASTQESIITGLSVLLKKIRERQNLTQNQLAEGIDVSISAIRKYEAGNSTNDYSISLLAKLADFLQVSLSDIFEELIRCSFEKDVNSENILCSMFESMNFDLTDDEKEFYSIRAKDSNSLFTSGNDIRWLLKFGAKLLALSDENKAEIEKLALGMLFKEKPEMKTPDNIKRYTDVFTFIIS